MLLLCHPSLPRPLSRGFVALNLFLLRHTPLGIFPPFPPLAVPLPPRLLCLPLSREFAGATWNAQALFSRCARRHLAKYKYVRCLGCLVARHDFVSLTETNSSTGEALAWRTPAGTRAWWSHGSSARAGVGIIAQGHFLNSTRILQLGKNLSLAVLCGATS